MRSEYELVNTNLHVAYYNTAKKELGSNNPTLRTFNAYPLTDRRRGRGGSSSTRRSYMANHVQYYDLLLSFRDWSVEHHGLNSKDWSTMSWQTSPVSERQQ